MTEKPNVQLVVSHLDGQTCYYPANAGWRVDPRDRCLVIGRGLPRKHIPLDTVASFDVEEIGADEPDPHAALVAKLIAELTRLDSVASERIAERPAGDLSAWHARGVRAAVRSLRIVAGLAQLDVKPCPCDQFCPDGERCDGLTTREALAKLNAEGREERAEVNAQTVVGIKPPFVVCKAPDPNNPTRFCRLPLHDSFYDCDFGPVDQLPATADGEDEELAARATAREVVTSIVEAGVAPTEAGQMCAATFAGEGSMACTYSAGHERINMLDREWDHGNAEKRRWWNEPELAARVGMDGSVYAYPDAVAAAVAAAPRLSRHEVVLGPSCRKPHPELAGHSCSLERGHEPGCAYAPDELLPDDVEPDRLDSASAEDSTSNCAYCSEPIVFLVNENRWKHAMGNKGHVASPAPAEKLAQGERP